MNYNWNWGVFFDPTALGKGQYIDWLLSGAVWTVVTGVCAWSIALTLGASVGILQTMSRPWLRRPAMFYTEIFSNIPLIVQMFLWYFVFPELLPREMAHWIKREMPYPEFVTAVVALGLFTASRIAVQVRAGIQAIPSGLRSAAYALGLSELQAYRLVLLPIGARHVIPPLTSEFMNVFKNTSVALTIGLVELTAQARQMNEYTFQGFETFTVATALYVTITLLANRLMVFIEKRHRIPGTIGSTR